MGYTRPVPYTGISTWRAHTRRVPPSQEAGVDYYCPIGTPVVAPAAGQVVAVGGGVAPATGRYVTIDLTDGRRVRYLHLSAWRVRDGQFVRAGDVIGLSGASGYGSEFFGASTLSRIPANTGGPHVHVTLWPRHAYTFGVNAGTLDFDAFADSNAPASGGGIEIIMDKETFIAWMWEFFKFRSRDGGNEASFEKGPTVFERLTNIGNGLGALTGLVNPDETNGGKGWFPFRNALSRWLTYHSRADGPDGKGATLHERLNQIENAVRASSDGDVKLTIDAATLATALADPKVAAALAGPIAKQVGDTIAERMRS